MITSAILCVVVSAGLCIRAKYADNRTQFYIFKPLTTALVITIAVLPGYDQRTEYWYLIVAGLLLCLAGDVFLMLPSSTLLFMVSDATLALDRFRGEFRSAQAVILSTYFASILLLSLSTRS